MTVSREPALARSKDCMSDRIKDVIVQRIASGEYAPGQRLVELQIAREFETSQAPVREALCELEAMRIVETEPYKGTRVREITSDEWQECLAVRGSLEQLAAETMGDRLKDKIEHLHKVALDSMEAARNCDIEGYRRANLEFHRTIIDACSNRTLVDVWYSLAPEIRMLAGVHANVEHLVESAEEHLEVVDAIKEGDNRYAGRLLKKHTETVLIHVKAQKA